MGQDTSSFPVGRGQAVDCGPLVIQNIHIYTAISSRSQPTGAFTACMPKQLLVIMFGIW